MKTIRIWLLVLAVTVIAAPMSAQETTAAKPATGHITGTVTDMNGDTLSGATVILQGSALAETRKLVSDDNGFFDFKNVDPGTYHVTVSAPDFGDWTSAELTLNPNQYMIVSDCKLQIAQVQSTVNVSAAYKPEEVAIEQVKLEETQRVFGIIPNFYVVYDPNPAPLTTKLKFHLAMKTSTDVFTVMGVGALAGMNQAGNTPNYRQGWVGYGERAGAVAADGFSDIMIGGAILPSLLHQDPRYFYKGTGTNRERTLHALASPFICRGDNGKLQPNYSSLGGDLSSSALSNLYYPPNNRGTALVFDNFLLTTGERMLSAVVQEFVIGRLNFKQKTRN